MKRLIACSVLGVAAVLSSCNDGSEVAAPKESRLRWGWDRPLATGLPGGQPELLCSPNPVAFLGQVTCTLANVGPMGFPTWQFVGGVTVNDPNPGQSTNWSGPMITSGDVTVYFSVEGVPDQRTQPVTVTRRASWSWASGVGGAQGAQGVIDTCMLPTEYGLTASVACTKETAADLFKPDTVYNGSGYTADTVGGSGPNHGLAYVSQTTATMDLRSQITKKLRTDGDTLPMLGDVTVLDGCRAAFPSAPTAGRNVYTVNTTCVPTADFGPHLTCIWNHEGLHVSLAVTEAQKAANDVYLLWEPMVASTIAGLQVLVGPAYKTAAIKVNQATAALHANPTNHDFMHWDNLGNWDLRTYHIYC